MKTKKKCFTLNFSFTGHYTTATFVNWFNLKNLTVCSVTSIDTCLSVYMKVLFGDFPLSLKCLMDKSATNTTVEKCSKTLTFPRHAYNLHVHPDCISFSHRHTCKTERVYYSVQSFSYNYAIVFHSGIEWKMCSRKLNGPYSLVWPVHIGSISFCIPHIILQNYCQMVFVWNYE